MKKKLLIVVDYQNDFVSGSLGFPEAEALEPKLHKKVQSAGGRHRGCACGENRGVSRAGRGRTGDFHHGHP